MAFCSIINSLLLISFLTTIQKDLKTNEKFIVEPQWQLVWNDEFDYPDIELDKQWNSQNGPSGHILCSRWRENVIVKDGFLFLKNKKENRGGQDWTSGSIWTKELFFYGRFECRYKYAGATGTNNSFWIMTTGIVPDSGKKFEIDINEGHYPSEMNTNLHNWTDITVDPLTGKQKHHSEHKSFDLSSTYGDLSSEFHTYGLTWTKDSLIFSFDGKIMRRMKNEFCHSPAPVYLSEAIINWAGEVTDSIDGTSMVVDWVRVYQPK